MSDDATPFELLPAEEVEELLPSYSQISFLAKGGMAAVYRGLQTSLERPVAIKMLPAEFGADESFRLRFVAEGKAMARLNHPNLVGIFDFGEINNLLYLVMEFVDGKTLHEHAYGAPMDELEAIDLCQKVADGLAHAHEHGILHRDIKPANVLLDSNNEPKLGDFGLAEGEERDDGDDLIFGTPGYTSPEVMANPAAADEKADIFAIGVMLHELITTTLPPEFYQPPSRTAGTDPRIDKVIARAIQPDPSHRHATAGELAEELKNLHRQMKAAPRRKLATSAGGSGAARALKVDAPAPPKNFSGPAASGAGVPPRPRSTSIAGAAPSSIPLVRNLIIIGMLCAAIAIAYSALTSKKKRVAKENQIQVEKFEREKARKAKTEADRIARLQGGSTLANKGKGSGESGSSEPHVSEVEAPSPLSPREQLEDLQSALKDGDRGRYPDGTEQRGSARYFFIPDAMTWHEAIEFAESYGGQLAVTPNESDLGWLAKAIPTEDDIWIGAGAISRSDWEWFDDTIEFVHKKPRTSTGTAAMLTNSGFIRAREPSLKLPFFIQWNEDGEQRGTRDVDLLQLAESLNNAKPSWPPGVLSLEERRYLILAQSLTFSEASAIAERAGGTLAVPSSEVEASFLMEVVAESGLSSLWIGGEKRDDSWAWITNEAWEFARWDEGYPLSAAKAIGLQSSATGWLNSDPFEDSPGFIIEWSDDAADAPAAEVVQNDGLAALNNLRAKARRLLSKDQQKVLQKTKSNFAAQGMAMRQMLRNISEEDARVIKKRYDDYLDACANAGNKLINPANSEVASSPSAVKILSTYYETQSVAEDKLNATAAKVRNHYLNQVDSLIADAEAKGLKAQIAGLEKEKVAVGTTGASFLKHLGL